MIPIAGLGFSAIVIYLIPMLIVALIFIEIIEQKRISLPIIKLLLVFIPIGLSALTLFIKAHSGYGYDIN